MVDIGERNIKVLAYGEVPERPKGHAWRACVPKRYRGFESHPLRAFFHDPML